MGCKVFLVTLELSGLIAPGIAAPAAKSSRDMNILMIMVEDWSAFAIGAYGNPVVRTPHTDRLARSGREGFMQVQNL